MKKLLLALGLFVTLSVSAQNANRDHRNDKAEVKQEQVAERKNADLFRGITLSSSQKAKIANLNKQKLSASAFDQRVQKILTQKQYLQYLKNVKDNEKSQAAHYDKEQVAQQDKDNLKKNKISKKKITQSKKEVKDEDRRGDDSRKK